MATRILGFVVAVACFVNGPSEATTNLKPFDPVAFQATELYRHRALRYHHQLPTWRITRCHRSVRSETNLS